MARIAIIGGTGYVGLVYAAAFAELGHDVIGLDTNAAKITMLSDGHSPIFEPGLTTLLQRTLQNGQLRFTTEYADAIPEADYVFICVGTPSNGNGEAEMMHVKAAASSVARYAHDHTIVINKSTMPVGSGQLVSRILSEHSVAEASFAVVSNPEFLREGAAVHDVFHPDRIVLGSDNPAAAEQVAALYAPLGAPILITDLRSAEMIKYASNAFLATKISFINEVAQICERVGAEIDVVAKGMSMDERIGSSFLRAGAGFGGSCLPKDVRALAYMAQEAGLDTNLLNAVLSINGRMSTLVVDKVRAHIGDLTGKTIAVLGLAFKPNTDDIREAPSLAVIEELLLSGATVRATDPVAIRHVATVFPHLNFAEDVYATVTGCDAVLLMTEWDEYRSIDLNRVANAMRGRLFVDGRNLLQPQAVTSVALVYEGIGRRLPLSDPGVTIGQSVIEPGSASDNLLSA